MKSLYIHIPFCKRICSYCDFAKVFYTKENIDKYLNYLEQEIISNYNHEKIETIYIGGGTPSCLSINELDKLFSIINKYIDLSNVKEYTIECNIESLTENKLKLFKENSINRLSIGVQSFDKSVLKYLNRDDDIDIIMPRPDYNKFLSENEREHAFCIGSIWNRSANIPFIKLFDTSTIIKQKYSKCYHTGHLWIDIFPLDGLPNSKISLFLHYKISRLMRKMLTLSESNFTEGTSRIKIIGKIMLYPVAKLIGAPRWAIWLDRFSQRIKFENSYYIGGLVWGYGPQERMVKAKFLPYSDVSFEGRKFHAPKCWHIYLKNLYGNYMKYPPKNKRLNHSMTAWKQS